MFKTFGNLATLIRQASSMGGKMNEINDQLKGQRVLGTAGGGMVTVEANGLGDVLKVSIDNTLVDSRDAELIEDLCAAATNQALGKSRQDHATRGGGKGARAPDCRRLTAAYFRG